MSREKTRGAWAWVVFAGCAAALGCSLYEDTGSPDPGPSYWPWVCDGGAPVPEGGCPEDDATEEGEAD
jgi:hypothetical protein